jgi:hypothetical protein
MTSDRDTYRTARLIIDRHGDEAGLYAAGRADQLLEAGDIAGAIVWRRIGAAIEELRRARRPDEAVN